MKTVATLGLVFACLMSACGSSAPKPDPYAKAAQAKRAEVARLDRLIDSLRAAPDAAALAGRIDSLAARKALELGNLAGIDGAAGAARSMADSGATMLNADAESRHVQEENRKYPIKKP